MKRTALANDADPCAIAPRQLCLGHADAGGGADKESGGAARRPAQSLATAWVIEPRLSENHGAAIATLFAAKERPDISRCRSQPCHLRGVISSSGSRN
jgi:hypothetical protein